MLKGDETVLIAYGSQTGNAQDLAERVWRHIKQQQRSKGVSSRSVYLSSCDKLELNRLVAENVVLLCVCSTCGQGDVPDNMQMFWRSIMRRSLTPGVFSNLKFACIGLGDSSYPKFNFTSKKLHKRLIQLGARPLLDLCLCDEQDRDGGSEAAFSKWLKEFLGGVQTTANGSSFFSRFKIVQKDATEKNDKLWNNTAVKTADELNPLFGELVRNERVTSADHFQDVRLIEIECGSDADRVKYESGDVCVLRPSNTRQNVEKFLNLFEHLNLDLSKRIRIESNFDELQCDVETTLVRTVGELVENYLDINSIPRMSFFELFGQLADDELEKEKLIEFTTTADGLDDLMTYCYRPRRTILEVFADFPKTTRRIESLEQLLDLVPSIKPRSFSIASSPTLHKSLIQLLVAVVEYKTRLYESRKGTCSFWLSTLKPGCKIPIWIKKGSFQLDLVKPVICIGPGTGVAPFRSIINERIYKHNLTNNHLYFGCRSRDKDSYFESEWHELRSKGACQVYTAFSRDQPEKIYVQDLLWQNRDDVFRLIDQDLCFILIAGNSKRMPEDVMAFLEKIVSHGLFSIKHTVDTEEKANQMAKEYIRSLEAQKRIQMETWS